MRGDAQNVDLVPKVPTFKTAPPAVPLPQRKRSPTEAASSDSLDASLIYYLGTLAREPPNDLIKQTRIWVFLFPLHPRITMYATGDSIQIRVA
jgi:hypothetical protein